MNKYLEIVFNANFSLRIGKRKVVFYLFCHRMPERCFTIRKHTMPICSRCLGTIIGTIVGLLFRIEFPAITIVLSLVPITFMPLVIDGTTQLLGIRKSDNLTRLLTGILAGMGVAMIAKFIQLLLRA